ncbi:MAG: N-acetylmannosamine-6-phosphate 2-epimerase [Enterococcus aquimarinus]|jgi:N-acylglucosamine-6-phosphate 2-epimerase|nr:N-acetylmannosamine-6-phosphate 2-epimerase [Enterococcus sp.]MBP9520969.1 N-acetylmannosamine-6-phosphate 2-epimerase [Enterococcus sp.]MBP9639007.1 N-acetylmannosamine-6-phosphate 2-epimerase [Enterococcus sp.]HRL50970.1 N-acetylmannosamine-6-phosphate 2-epimerase [Enterococcus aquimarinus]HRM23615.1 N-acetylmannosamine-6-phosphate 2-epimerase [Enterococcus aquimarinus]
MLDQIKGKLVISCQALPGEPLHSPMIMGRMAIAAKNAGAAGIRAQGVADIIEIKQVTGLPVIGIIKRNYPDSEVFITATKKEVQELLATDCEMIALDATIRPRPNGELLQDLLDQIHAANRLAMADCSTVEEAKIAEEMGFDCVSTTLAGYTSYSTQTSGPDVELVKQLVKDCQIPVIAEGKIHTPEQLKEIMNLGVYSAVVGGAITRPQEIAQRFIAKLEEE